MKISCYFHDFQFFLHEVNWKDVSVPEADFLKRELIDRKITIGGKKDEEIGQRRGR